MRRFALIPLTLAISTVTLSGCLGGGGGGGSSNQPPTEQPGGGVTYTLSVDIPEASAVTQASSSPSPAAQLANALINILVPPALAELVNGLQPSDFKLKNLGNDEEKEIDSVEDNGDGSYSVTIDEEVGLDHYFEILLSNAPAGINTGIRFSVPISGGSLVATPITTLVTKLLANRISQLDELEPAEINQLIEEIEGLVSESDDIQQALYNAIYTSTSTEELLEQVGARLTAVIDNQLDEKASPPLTSNLAAQAAGSYYEAGSSLGVFQGGYLTGGYKGLNIDISIAGNQATFQRAANNEFQLESVNVLGHGFSSDVRTWVHEEDSGTLPVDSRGFHIPFWEEVVDYDRSSGEIPHCAPLTADCSDREFDAASRLLAAGPSDAPFNVLIDSGFDLREVRDRNADNQIVTQVVNSSLGVIIKKSASRPTLSGTYGLIELISEQYGTLDISTFVSSFDFSSNNTVEFCETVERALYINLNSSSASYNSSPSAAGENCDDGIFSLADNGELQLGADTDELAEDPLSGWVSADGLTLVLTKSNPTMQDVLDSDEGDRLWVDEGEHQFVLGVKPAQNAELSNKRYRLFALGVFGENNTLDAHRFNAGYLDFDNNVSATLSASVQFQETSAGGLGEGSNSDALNINLQQPEQVSISTDGHVTLTADTLMSDARAATFTANGYIQEGERLLILSYHLETDDGNAVGLLLGVLQ